MSVANVLILVCVAVVVLGTLALLVWLLAMSARPGYEDDAGFHEGERKDTSRRGTEKNGHLPSAPQRLSGRTSAVLLAFCACTFLGGCWMAGCRSDDGPTRYPGGTDQPYSTSNGVPIHLPQEV